MNKILYILPALAVLGMFSAADADTTQERIDKLQAKIDKLSERIDKLQNHIDKLQAKIDGAGSETPQQRIDKWEAKIDKMHERKSVLVGKWYDLKLEKWELEPPGDMRPPRIVNATLNMDTGILTTVLDETIDISETQPEYLLLDFWTLGGSVFDDTAPDSNILAMTLSERVMNMVENRESMSLRLYGGNPIKDLAGNEISFDRGPVPVDKIYE